MTAQEYRNQLYLQWYFGMWEPQTSWGAGEIRPWEIVSLPQTSAFTNPWAFNGPVQYPNADNGWVPYYHFSP